MIILSVVICKQQQSSLFPLLLGKEYTIVGCALKASFMHFNQTKQVITLEMVWHKLTRTNASCLLCVLLTLTAGAATSNWEKGGKGKLCKDDLFTGLHSCSRITLFNFRLFQNRQYDTSNMFGWMITKARKLRITTIYNSHDSRNLDPHRADVNFFFLKISKNQKPHLCL